MQSALGLGIVLDCLTLLIVISQFTHALVTVLNLISI